MWGRNEWGGGRGKGEKEEKTWERLENASLGVTNSKVFAEGTAAPLATPPPRRGKKGCPEGEGEK